MNSVIICEGYTDLTLIQYYMEVANGWKYCNGDSNLLDFHYFRNFNKDNNSLMIGESGGCKNIKSSFDKVLLKNTLSADEEDVFTNIVIICDRDEADTEENFIAALTQCLDTNVIECDTDLENDKWVHCTTMNQRQRIIHFRVLLLIIPFEDTGALETFLLSAISENDEYDKYIIDSGNKFVDTVDNENRYLTRKRFKTKAKFDVYFSIRTPVELFEQRRTVLRGIPWEKYETVQKGFRKLKELG